MKTRAQFLTVVTGVLVLGAAAIAAAYLFTRPEAFATTDADSYAGQPTLGDPDAPVKLILFENFMCEHCRAFEAEVFPQLRRDYIDTGRVEAYYVNLAWGSEQAELGGLAGECAYTQNEAAFWSYKRLLYEQQGSWQDVSDLATLANEVPELDSERLEACVTEGDTRSDLERDLELAVRSALHRRGLRFRKNVKALPGSPDIVFPKAKVAVFVDGKFWHGYDFDTWKDRLQPFWRAKIERNIERDAGNNRDLEALCWTVLRFWQHEIKENLPNVVDRIAATIEERQNR